AARCCTEPPSRCGTHRAMAPVTSLRRRPRQAGPPTWRHAPRCRYTARSPTPPNTTWACGWRRCARYSVCGEMPPSTGHGSWMRSRAALERSVPMNPDGVDPLDTAEAQTLREVVRDLLDTRSDS